MLTETQAERIKSTFRSIPASGPSLGDAFYEILFSAAPSVRSFFADDITLQAEKLGGILEVVVSSADNLEKLLPDLEALGRSHLGYGVNAQHYEILGVCLIETLSQLVPGWTDEDALAWQSLYQTASGAMIVAADDTTEQKRSA